MTYWIMLRFDASGACPLVLRDDSEPVTGGQGVRYRLVARTDDGAEAARVAELLQRRCQTDELN